MCLNVFILFVLKMLNFIYIGFIYFVFKGFSPSSSLTEWIPVVCGVLLLSSVGNHAVVKDT